MASDRNTAGTTVAAEPLSVETFVARALRSAALREHAELEIMTESAIIRGRPDESNYVGDLWHRTREQIGEERHQPGSRLPEAVGGTFIELSDVRVAPLSAPDRESRFEDLVVFTRHIVGIRATGRPERMTAAARGDSARPAGPASG